MKKTHRTTAWVFALAAGTLWAGGCASAPEKTVFLPPNAPLQQNPAGPAKKIWRDPSAAMSRYHNLMIAPVRTDLQLPKSWLERHNLRAELGKEQQDLQELAGYMRKAFERAVMTHGGRLGLATEPSADTAILELAIVKVVPNKPMLETGATVGAAVARPVTLCLIPVKSVISHETKSPLCSYIAIEGRVRDSKTGKTLVMFTMDAAEDPALLDVNKYMSPYANVKKIINRWALQFAATANRATGDKNAPMPTTPTEHDYALLRL